MINRDELASKVQNNIAQLRHRRISILSSHGEELGHDHSFRVKQRHPDYEELAGGRVTFLRDIEN